MKVTLTLTAEIEVDPEPGQDPAELAREKLNSFRESALPSDRGILLFEGKRYVVLTADGGDQPCLFHETRPPVLCETKEEVVKAVLAAEERNPDGYDWMVFEVVDGKCVQRSVTYPHDPVRAEIA